MLPWKFTSLDETRYVLTNMVGEFLTLERADVASFAEGRLVPGGSIYNDLKARHFLLDDDTDVAIDLLALKARTKLEPLANFTSLHIFVATLRCESATADLGLTAEKPHVVPSTRHTAAYFCRDATVRAFLSLLPSVASER